MDDDLYDAMDETLSTARGVIMALVYASGLWIVIGLILWAVW